MFRTFLASSIVSLAAGAAFAEATRFQQPVWAADTFGGYASTHIVVKFHAGFDPTATTAVETDLSELHSRWQVENIRPLFNRELKNAEAAEFYGLNRYFILEVPSGTDTPAMAAEYGALPAFVEIAEIDGIGGVAVIPDDPDFDLLYGMHNTGQVIQGSVGVVDADIDAPEAWDLHTGTGDITVAVVDSGVNVHVDYSDKLLQGYNSTNGGTNTIDGCPHGTHVAGTVGANGNNALGVVGVNWGVQILPIRVLTGCSGTEVQCADGITWAADNGADICTMSLQYYTFVQYFQDAVDYAHDSGVLLIAATGNNAGTVAWPAKFANCMGIGASTNKDQIASFSNKGPEVDVAAAGENVWSTWGTSTYTYLSGTSMATPHTSGLASLIWSFNPALTNDEVRDILISTAEDKGTPGFDTSFGNGRINALAALEAAGGGGGGIPCDAIRNMRVRCTGGTLRVVVIMTDNSHDGETVTVTVNGTSHDLTVQNGRARLVTPATGDWTVSLDSPAGCFAEMNGTCN